MAPRVTCGCIALAFIVALFSLEPETAQAAPLSGMKALAPHSLALCVFFRLSGRGAGRFGGRSRAYGARPRGTSKRFLYRDRRGGSRTIVTGRREPVGTPPRIGGGDRPPFPRRPQGGPAEPVIVPGAVATGTVFTIMGAGGAGRPPIAPRFTGAPGQNPAQVAAALLANKRHRPRELLAEVSGETPDSVKDSLAREYGVEIADVGFIELAGVRIWRLTLRPGQNLAGLLTALLQDGRVLTVQPNYIYTPVQGPPAEKRTSPAEGAAFAQPPRKQPPTGAGVKLAIIDTCIEAGHDELRGAVASTFDAVQPGSGPCKPENHGTAVASLIAGHSKLHGTAEGASLLSAKAFSFTSEEHEIAATTDEVALSMNWAAQTGAQVMNLSFAGPADPVIERVAAAAYRKGIALVAAAGNAGPSSPPLYPAAYPEVIAVTATNGKRQIYSAANRGKYISVSARGVDVLTAQAGNTYGLESGTSFAAAEVSGVVACLLEKRPKAGPVEIRAALQDTATAVPGAARDEAGFGFVNREAAVAFVETSLPQ